MMTPEQLIEKLGLVPLEGEGGLFRQTYVDRETFPQSTLPKRYTSDKPLSTSIYYLLTSDFDSFSAMHKLPTVEVFHFYLGDPVEMLNLYPDGSHERVTLGQDIMRGQRVQHVVPVNVWQGCYVLPPGKFALMGTTMAPGYTDEDYVGGQREALIRHYPYEAALITRLTRG
jgi:uncharacterized protein